MHVNNVPPHPCSRLPFGKVFWLAALLVIVVGERDEDEDERGMDSEVKGGISFTKTKSHKMERLQAHAKRVRQGQKGMLQAHATGHLQRVRPGRKGTSSMLQAHAKGHFQHVGLGRLGFSHAINGTLAVEDPPQVEVKYHAKQDHANTKGHVKQEDTGGSRIQVLAQVAVLTRLFAGASVVVILTAGVFELIHMRWSDVDWTRHDTLLDSDPDKLDVGKMGLHGFGSIATMYFRGDGRRFGTIAFSGILVLIIIGTLIEQQMNFVTGVFWDAMQEKDYEKFLTGLSCFLVMLPGAFLIWAYRSYINGMLQIHWQHSLVRHLQKAWLGHCAYSVGQLRAPNEKLSLENPDQRIEEDAYEFVKSWLSLTIGVLRAIPTFVVWMPIVVSLSPDHIFALDSMPVFRPWLLVIAIIWCVFTSSITHAVGKNIILVSYAKERYYADFRMGLSRIRNNADQIAMLHAEESEERNLDVQFEKIKRCFWERIQIDKVMSIVGFLLGQGSDLFPLIFLSYAYFTGNVGLGHFIRIRMAVSNIQDSMSWFVNSYTTIAKFQSTSNRLVEMLDHCKKLNDVRLLAPQIDANMPRGGLQLTSAKGRLPTGTLLWSIEDLFIQEDEWTLIRGSEGSGKTTLLRLLAGAWPVQENTELLVGTNDKSKDNQEDSKQLSFVPAGAYRLRAGLPLKQAVCYPHEEECFADDDVAEALEVVGLKKLLDEFPPESNKSDAEGPEEGAGRQRMASDAEKGTSAWPALHSDHGDRMLSAGEAQRLELAHVMLTRPRWCFLDEPVSHIAEDDKAALFEILRSRLKGSSTLVTITHDVSSLTCFHDTSLELRGGELRKVAYAA